MSGILQTALRCSATHSVVRIKQSVSQLGIRAFTTTNTLCAEPPRKKRRLDPAVFKVRVERKIKKIEREIANLESATKQPIPILEYELTNSDIRDLNARPQHKMEDFALNEGTLKAAKKLWSFYRQEESRMEKANFARMERAQDRALEHMKTVDQELYDDTVTIDDTILVPYRSNHMRKETGPNKDYKVPDGYVKDVSKEWVM